MIDKPCDECGGGVSRTPQIPEKVPRKEGKEQKRKFVQKVSVVKGTKRS